MTNRMLMNLNCASHSLMVLGLYGIKMAIHMKELGTSDNYKDIQNTSFHQELFLRETIKIMLRMGK